MSSDAEQPPTGATPLREQVQAALADYFRRLDGHPPPLNFYQLVLQQVEPPLLDTVLAHTGGNQSKAAEILGISRATLRKKLRHYGLV